MRWRHDQCKWCGDNVESWILSHSSWFSSTPSLDFTSRSLVTILAVRIVFQILLTSFATHLVKQDQSLSCPIVLYTVAS